ncbi:VOC family protein [Auraticoccus sp. F435]|uniref:Bleomycin resistance protein n=1 Tax=Auraticoccus cholistanensis TaxID=2656650 RepID=A0A6A9URE4_9ACTN|nr:glyoxalase superfamily protein [Auraticoccus cholistanensis]MVA75313.1 VOC family protein [Auraticoccus cholistanensis]
MASVMRAAVPVLRIGEEARAREFYLGVLGLSEVFAHRFEPGLPLYLRVRRDRLELDLSEHTGDGTPGTVVWVAVDDVAALQGELAARWDAGAAPQVDDAAPGGPTLEVGDPFGNVLRFCQPG